MINPDPSLLREYIYPHSNNHITYSISRIYENICEFTTKQLREAYRKNFEWIDHFIDDLYKGKSGEYIKDKYRVEFVYDDPEVPDDGSIILQGGYNREFDEYIIWPGEKLNQLFDKPQYKKLIYNEFEKFLVHEYIHRQQNQLKSNKQEFDPDYLNQHQEQSAFAYSIAHDARKKNPYIDSKEIINLLMDDPDQLKLSKSSLNYLNEYKRIGGDLYKNFLKHVYQFFSDDFLDDPIEYKQLLKNSATAS